MGRYSYDRRAAEDDTAGQPQSLSGHHQLVVDVYEEATKEAYPVVRHIFVGKTRAEAQGYYEAHLKTDAFMRGCVEKDKWETVKCRHVSHWIEPKAKEA